MLIICFNPSSKKENNLLNNVTPPLKVRCVLSYMI